MKRLTFLSVLVLAGCSQPAPRPAQVAKVDPAQLAREQEELHAQIRLMKSHAKMKPPLPAPTH